MDRNVTRQVTGFATIDGAGVHLIRVLGNTTLEDYDPFLMLDSFDSTHPEDYTAGFPMHPHRGIETISYVHQGKMEHRDSLGFDDMVTDGEVQYMTAGSGILHEEQVPAAKRLCGLQLWLNLPAKDKMAQPEYTAIKRADIPEITIPGGKLRLLLGSYKEWKGTQSRYLPLDYYAIELEKGASLTLNTEENRSCMLFTLEGSIQVGQTTVAPKTAAKLSRGSAVTLVAEQGPAIVMFMSSVALHEPVCWGGPIVMNTRKELEQAFQELQEGTFLKAEMKHQ